LDSVGLRTLVFPILSDWNGLDSHANLSDRIRSLEKHSLLISDTKFDGFWLCIQKRRGHMSKWLVEAYFLDSGLGGASTHFAVNKNSILSKIQN